MKSNLSKIFIAIIFILFAGFLFYKNEYFYGIILIIFLIPLAKLEALTNLILNKEGFQAEFQIPKEKTLEKLKKLEEEIKENKQPVTRQNYIHFQNIESKILAEQQKKYGSQMKTLVHFMYGKPEKPEFMYTPDGSLNKDGTLYFFEIKYILKPEFAENIVKKTTEYLKTIYEKFAPYAGGKIIIKLILASGYDIDPQSFTAPKGIEIEFIKI